MSSSQRFIFRTGLAVIGGSVYGVTAYYSYFAFKRTEKLQEAAAGAATTTATNTSTHLVHGQGQQQWSEGVVCRGCGCSSSSASLLLSPYGGERAQQFSRIAECYDSAIGMDEFFMGINVLRRVLVRWHAQGTVLEVGAGTGRNIPYYAGSQAKRVVLVDASATMLERAQEKIRKLNHNNNNQQQQSSSSDTNTNKQQRLQYVVKQADSASLQFCPNQSFDTVIDTFGLCSYEDPVAVLKEMVRVCKPNGKLLFLEHGRSKSWSWISNFLDKYQEQHAERWGCVWNRDLDALFEAVSDVVEIKILNIWHFGTTYYVVCQPKQPTPASPCTTTNQ